MVGGGFTWTTIKVVTTKVTKKPHTCIPIDSLLGVRCIEIDIHYTQFSKMFIRGIMKSVSI